MGFITESTAFSLVKTESRFKRSSGVIFEIHSTYIFNSNTILERNIRSILLNILQNDEFLNKTNKLWQEKLDNDKKIEEEKISKRKQIKSDYDDIIKELDGHSNIKGDSVRW